LKYKSLKWIDHSTFCTKICRELRIVIIIYYNCIYIFTFFYYCNFILKTILFFLIKIIYNIYRHRDEALNIARGILQDTYFSELEDENSMDVEEYSSPSKLQYRSKINRMMMSEWMLDVPQDLSENWIMVPCPVGKRTRLVSGRVLIYLLIFNILLNKHRFPIK